MVLGRKLASLFPPPEYMMLPSVGIDVSDASLKYIQFVHSHAHASGIKLSLWGDMELPEGTVVQGEVQKVDELARILKEVRKKTGADYARVALPERHAYIFETTITRGASHSEIRGRLEFEMEENVPISPRDAFFDYEIVEDTMDKNMLRVVVTVYGKATILKYYDACTQAGLTPLSFEVEPEAIARAVAHESAHGSSMIVDFGELHTGIGIVHANVLVHTSTIDVGGKTLSTAMRAVLGECTEEEITEIKNTHGLLSTHKDKAVQEAIKKVIENVANELRSHINYWNERSPDEDGREVAEVVLCGGSANLAGLPEYLTESLKVPTHRAEVWQHVFKEDSATPPIPKNYSYGYATAVGLALSGINSQTS